jgi:predicted ATP-binding protein involved in virulence
VETRGVVLIDELDLHLHPAWQRRVISDLKRTFPNIQFFATTHSPQLIGQAEAQEVLLLDLEGHTRPGQSFGMDSNWVLKHVMGSQDRDPEIARRLDALFDMLENEQYGEARREVSALREKIGRHPDLVEADAYIDRYTRFDTEEPDRDREED